MTGLKEIDQTEEAKIIVDCFIRMRAESAEVTVNLLCLTLLGSKSQVLKSKSLMKISILALVKLSKGVKGVKGKMPRQLYKH